jgi:membrane-associated phospholipid phosphatase
MSRPLREPSSRNGRLCAAIAVALVCAAWVPEARADDAEAAPAAQAPAAAPTATPRTPLRYNLWIDVPVTLGLVAGVVVWSNVEADVLPRECRFCDGPPGQVNAVDDFFRTAFRRNDVKPAQTASDVLAYGVSPVAAVGFGALAAGADGRLDEAPLNTVLVAEATSVSLAMTEMFKSIFERERPYVHAVTDPDAHAALIAQKDTLVSFPSGHTSTTFALAASAGTIATLRGYRVAPLIWIAGGLLGLTTGYMRMAADKHYFTDVVAGAALGTGVGIGVPLLFHRPASGNESAVGKWLHRATISSSPVPGGRVVSLGWAL